MKKSHFLTIAFTALAMVGCGNKTDNANNTEDSATVEDSTRLSGNLVGISINLCKSIQKELFINNTP